jgi:V/A-type H+-transporting ATPase subunit D
MARLNVNPTRIQLKTLKGRLSTATRGHKLLKDKLDEMIRNYSILIKENYKLRLEYEEDIRQLLKNFCLSKCYMSKNDVNFLFAVPSMSIEPVFGSRSIMNVIVPEIGLNEAGSVELPYSFIDTNPLFDSLVKQTKEVMPKLLRLSSIEKTCQILATQIEYTKRQVNSLENLTIPQLEETIKYITMKIDENERSSRIRQMKVKSITNNNENNL